MQQIEKNSWEFESEAQRIRIVAKAKAEAESKKLQGQRYYRSKREIARGLVESVEVFEQCWYKFSRSLGVNCGYTTL